MQQLQPRASENFEVRTLNILVIAFAIVFAVLYRHDPLYTNNQNTKFLVGAAQAGYGHLAADWTANTIDPLPVFTLLVRAVYATMSPLVFHVLFTMLLALYAFAAVSIARTLHAERTGTSTTDPLHAMSFVVLFLWLSCASIAMITGVADQYILGGYFQPCVFGTFAVLAPWLWIKDARSWGALALAVAAIMHPGAYLLTTVLLLVALTAVSARTKTWMEAVPPIALFVAVVAPIMTYQAWMLAPTSPETFKLATDILANTRIPEHTDVARWMTASALAKFAWMILACVLVRRQPHLFWGLLTLTAVAVVCSFVLYLWPYSAARFATPWRVTAVAMPLATIIIVYEASLWLAILAKRHVDLRWVWGGLAACLIGLCTVSVAKVILRDDTSRHGGILAFAKDNAAAGQHYLIPGGMYEFRMATGLPAFVTGKTHPYKDIEVLEWKRRLDESNKVYGLLRAGPEAAAARDTALQGMVERYGITHVAVPSNAAASLPGFREVFRDGQYAVYQRQ